MDMSKLRRELDGLKGGLEDINSLLVKTETSSKDMVQRLANLSSIAHKGGIVRSIITRASAGIPGVYSLMQQLSSMLLVFKYLVVARNADLKKEQEMIETLKKREEVQKRLLTLGKALDGGMGGLSRLEKEKFYNDASIKHMMKTMSLTEALTITQQRFFKIKDSARKVDDKVLSKQRKQYVRDNFRGQSFYNRTSLRSKARNLFDGGGKPPTSGQDMFGGNLEAKAGILMADKQVEETKKRRMGMVGERNNREKEYKKKLTELGKADNKKKERLIKRELDLMEEELRLRNERIESIKEELTIARDDRDAQIEAGSNKFTTSGSGDARTFEDLGPFEKAQLKFIKFKEGVEKKVENVKKGLKSFFSKGNMGLMKNFLGKGMMLIGYALLAILGIGLLVYIMKKTGVWDKISDFFKTQMPLIRLVAEEFIKAFMMLFVGVINWVSGVWKIIKGLYTGDGKMIKKGILQMLEGLYGILLGSLGLIGSVVGGLLLIGMSFINSIFWAGVGFVGDKLSDVKNAILEKAGNVGGGAIIGAIGAGLGIAALVATGVIAAPALATVASVMAVGAIAGMVAGGIKDHKENNAADAIAGMASGGIVASSGKFLVGENGPELVTLPGGSSVMNNTNTRSRMGNTINIHVNGRLGASDTELNEIARKIGNKINLEMNRFNSRGYRA